MTVYNANSSSWCTEAIWYNFHVPYINFIVHTCILVVLTLDTLIVFITGQVIGNGNMMFLGLSEKILADAAAEGKDA